MLSPVSNVASSLLTRLNRLAFAELFITIATLVRRFDFELFETTRRDVDPARDFFIPKSETDNSVRMVVRDRKM